jgi:NADP-dependent 3-hydroxy acid dehydrogenase YdfG
MARWLWCPSSIVGHGTYRGGAGYVAAKHGAHMPAETLRPEIAGQPVRVVEVAPGMVRTQEFALTRFAATWRRRRRSTRAWSSC